MAKIWDKVEPEGREVLKQLDASQRLARERGQDPLSEEQTRKITDRLIKPVNVDKE